MTDFMTELINSGIRLQDDAQSIYKSVLTVPAITDEVAFSDVERCMDDFRKSLDNLQSQTSDFEARDARIRAASKDDGPELFKLSDGGKQKKNETDLLADGRDGERKIKQDETPHVDPKTTNDMTPGPSRISHRANQIGDRFTQLHAAHRYFQDTARELYQTTMTLSTIAKSPELVLVDKAFESFAEAYGLFLNTLGEFNDTKTARGKKRRMDSFSPDEDSKRYKLDDGEDVDEDEEQSDESGSRLEDEQFDDDGSLRDEDEGEEEDDHEEDGSEEPSSYHQENEADSDDEGPNDENE